ncbi:MAG: preprotein translocase subunit SecG [Aeriscardovia sp.]|nr:preprotein translocase subunit SecG [Aeriscardovia sp.]
MKVVLVILDIIVVIASILLTLLILMHKGKGGGISDMFGGGIGSNAGTSGVAEKNLNRITVIVALIWLAVIIALGLLARFGYTL